MRLTTRRSGGRRFLGPSNIKVKGTFQSRKLADTVQSYFQQWDWLGNVKPQLDLALTLGATGVHMLLNAYSEGNAWSTSAVARAQTRQLLDYTAQQGLVVHASLYTAGQGGADIAAQVAHAAIAEQYPHVAGFDLWNECNLNQPDPTAVVTYLTTARPQLKAVTSIPLTCSLTFADMSVAPNSQFMRAMNPLVDFWDFHGYGASWPYNMTPLRAADTWKPYVIGEAWTERTSSTAVKQAYYVGMLAMLAEPDCMGVFANPVIDFVAGSTFGIYPALGGTADATILAGFQALTGVR